VISCACFSLQKEKSGSSENKCSMPHLTGEKKAAERAPAGGGGRGEGRGIGHRRCPTAAQLQGRSSSAARCSRLQPQHPSNARFQPALPQPCTPQQQRFNVQARCKDRQQTDRNWESASRSRHLHTHTPHTDILT